MRPELRNYCDDGVLSQYTNLSNGDTVTYEANIDIELVEDLFKVKIKDDEKKDEFVAGGFEVVPTFDPFEYLEVAFTGYSPEGQIILNKTSYDGEAGYLDFYADKHDSLANGDVVTIKCELISSEKSFVENFGSLPNVREKQYTVEGLMAYVLNSGDIPAETLALMKSQAESAIATKFANWYDYGSNTNSYSARSVSSAEYIGNYFLVMKDGYSPYGMSGKNICYLVYRVNTSEDMVAYKAAEVVENAVSYVAIGFVDVSIDGTGAGNVDISRYDFKYDNWNDSKPYPYNGWGNTFNPLIYGYQSLDLLYNDVITKNAEEYNYENNVTE